MKINSKDLAILRELAKRQLEIANGDQMQALHREWLLHNTFKGERPMVTIELVTFGKDFIPAMLQCEGEAARSWEYSLRSNIINHEIFEDDTIVRNFIPVKMKTRFKPFGIDIQIQHAQDSIGHHFEPVIEDLEADFEKLKKSEFFIDRAETTKYVDECNELFGDILPAKIVGSSLYAVPTQNIVHIMSMENIYFAMCDYPDLFKQMMDNISNDYVEYFQFLSGQNALYPTTSSEGVGQGTYCFTDELPAEKSPSIPFTSKDLWGFSDSQEMVGISADMFNEFIFPYYKKIVDCFGLLSYGCCEPVDPLWEKCISQFSNLRKLSISPWCNEEYMGERLAGSRIIYHRKPSPNYLGVGTVLDEEDLRHHIRRTLLAAKGCKIEFTQRDVYQINQDVNKVKRYIQIIREEIADHYQ